MSNAFDLDQVPTDETIAQAKAAGIEAIAMYSRLVTLEVAQKISAAGMKLVLIAEWGGGDDYSTRTAEQGLIDAEMFLHEIGVLGVQPPGVYFCGADFDATADQIAGGCTDYLRAVKNGIAPIGLGGYGNGALCAYELNQGVIEKAFVWAGRGTNGTVAFMESGRASVTQGLETNEFGVAVDPDSVSGDYWGFTVPVPVVATETAAPGLADWYTRTLFYTAPMMTGEDVSAAQRLLSVNVDGVYGRQTEAAVRAFQQLSGIPVDGILGPATAQHLSAPA